MQMLRPYGTVCLPVEQWKLGNAQLGAAVGNQREFLDGFSRVYGALRQWPGGVGFHPPPRNSAALDLDLNRRELGPVDHLAYAFLDDLELRVFRVDCEAVVPRGCRVDGVVLVRLLAPDLLPSLADLEGVDQR